MKTQSILLAAMLFSSLTFAQGQIKVAFVGSFITQGLGRDNPGSYALQEGALLGDSYEVKNFGVKRRADHYGECDCEEDPALMTNS
jgi:acyl-CoA thioesterase-1